MECKHGLEQDWCGDCNPAPVEQDAGTVFIATFDSACDTCGGPIYEGDRALASGGEYHCQDHIPEPEGDPDPFDI